MHVTAMCFDKKTCAYQAATTHLPFDRFTTKSTMSSSGQSQIGESWGDGRVRCSHEVKGQLCGETNLPRVTVTKEWHQSKVKARQWNRSK